jgi:hypothetical protein
VKSRVRPRRGRRLAAQMLDRQADAAEHPHKASNTAEVLDPVIKTLIKTSRFAHSPEGYVPQQLRQWLSWEGVWVRLDNLGRLGQCKGQPESWRPGPLEFGVTTGLPAQAYPQPGRGAADGTGDFGSASRGGPAPAA